MERNLCGYACFTVTYGSTGISIQIKLYFMITLCHSRLLVRRRSALWRSASSSLTAANKNSFLFIIRMQAFDTRLDYDLERICHTHHPFQGDKYSSTVAMLLEGSRHTLLRLGTNTLAYAHEHKFVDIITENFHTAIMFKWLSCSSELTSHLWVFYSGSVFARSYIHQSFSHRTCFLIIVLWLCHSVVL